ncbi:MAG: hypothetical protein ABSE08_10665 [Syntrophobacteraceae bacterium]
MKRISIFFAVIGIFGLVLCGSSPAATVTVNLKSAVGAQVYGPVSTDFAGNPTGTSTSAAALGSVPASWPQAPAVSELTGAIWITPTPPLDTSATENFSLFQDSFTPPCTAVDLAGTVGTLSTAANNLETVYFNKDPLGTSTDSGSGPPVLDSLTFVPVQGENTFGFDVDTHVASGTTNPVGLIYEASITFTVPTVVWRPPINTGRTILKNGTTLPIKFVLTTSAGTLHKSQNIYLSITGPSGEVVRFAPGQGLTFARGNGQYHANFHTKSFGLQTGVQYTISVVDACSGSALSSLPMQIYGKAPHGKK